jgi:glycosyltransferase involved in cell wall biosynthesis
LIDSEDKRQPFDIFHGFSLMAAYPCLGFASKGARPVIASIRGIDGIEFDKLTIDVLRRSSWITSVSSDSLNRAMAVRNISSCSTVVPNGVDPSRFLPWRSTQTNQGIVGTIATFRPKKNIPLLIKAYSRVPINIRKQLLLVGDSFHNNMFSTEGRRQLDMIIEDLGIASEVEMAGYIDNARLSEYHHRMRVFVLSSDHEGMPNALLEAAAAGMPIVATAVDGVKDIFTNGKDALLVEPGNLVMLSEAIEYVLTNEDLACRLGSEALATAAQLTVEAEIKRYVELYRILLSFDA